MSTDIVERFSHSPRVYREGCVCGGEVVETSILTPGLIPTLLQALEYICPFVAFPGAQPADEVVEGLFEPAR